MPRAVRRPNAYTPPTLDPARRPLRVLVVVNDLGLGGTERMLERLVLALSESGRVQFTVCCLGELGPIGARMRSRGVEVFALGARGGTVRVVLQGWVGVRRLLRERPFDLIHSFLYRSHCASRLARLGFSRPAPLISSERCLGDNRSWVVRLVNRLTGRMSDRIVAVSGAVRDRTVERDRVPSGRVVVVRNGIEPSAPNPAARARLRRRLGIAGDDIVLLMLGRLHREKGPDILLEALGNLAASGLTGWRSILVGSGEQRMALEARAKALRLGDRVAFMGARHRVDPWIDACDLLVLPSREEGMPVAAIEAMMKGKPVVAARVGGVPEVVRHGETGLLVASEDPAALAAGILGLMKDGVRREALGRRGMEVARSEFSLDRMTDEIVSLYESLLPARHVPSPGVGEVAVPRPGRA